jgi:hypothetical protein
MFDRTIHGVTSTMACNWRARNSAAWRALTALACKLGSLLAMFLRRVNNTTPLFLPLP